MKYLLSRSAMNRIYCTFILPLLEYACEVWGGCSKFDEDKLEKVQLEAARIVTGMPLFASRESLYFETGWESLKDRQIHRKLTLFHKIYNHDVPSFLSDIVDPLRRNNIRNLRNTFDFEVPNYRLQSTLNSYFPSTIRLWNNLEQDLRHNYTQNQFKSILNSRRDCFVIPWVPIFVDWTKNYTFVGFKIRGHGISLHSSYRKSLFRGYWISWIGPSTITTKIAPSPTKIKPSTVYYSQFCDLVIRYSIITLFG